ncbi:MAG: hypothetical protein LBG58_05140 [Planctomycetaceae bacterium]|nr:hypothetical protein [Planctomycetaceae bacterium]
MVNNVYLSYGYLIIYLLLIIKVIYGIIESPGSTNISYWELSFLRVVTIILVPLLISCIFVWGAWILFNKHELLINTFELQYKLIVIFPIIQYKIPIREVRVFLVNRNNSGFGIFFSTIEKSRYVFHSFRYNCSRSYEKEISELATIVQSIMNFLKQQKKRNNAFVKQKTNLQAGRWKCCFVNEYQQFTRRGSVLPLISYISCIIVGLFFIGVTTTFSVAAFCFPLPDKSVSSLLTIGAIRIFVVILIPLCIYFLISMIIMILHLFTRFSILIYPDRIVSQRNIFGLNLTKTWNCTDIKEIKKSHTKEYSVWDFFRNPESTIGQINPAPYSIQFFDHQNNLLGEIKDLLLGEASAFIDTIEKAVVLVREI